MTPLRVDADNFARLLSTVSLRVSSVVGSRCKLELLQSFKSFYLNYSNDFNSDRIQCKVTY